LGPKIFIGHQSETIGSSGENFENLNGKETYLQSKVIVGVRISLLDVTSPVFDINPVTERIYRVIFIYGTRI
jgi:hypothetical protein